MKLSFSPKSSEGFTLVEILLAMVVSGLILAAMFTLYQAQQKQYKNQLEITDIQQNLRGALNILSRDIRMAGFDDPDASVAEIINAETDLFYFTYDNNEDGDVDDAGEHIAYDIYTDADGYPVLGRTTSNGTITVVHTPGHSSVTNPAHQPVANNIEHLEFFYLDKNGTPTTEEEQVRTVFISLVGRARLPDREFTNSTTYNPASNVADYNTSGTLSGRSWAKNDNYRRRMQILRIECRNMGI